MLRIYCLGQFFVQIDGQTVDIPSRPAQSLFAYLALNAGLVHRRERLAGLLWPDSNDENARGYLRQGLWRIRKALENVGARWQDFFQIDEISASFYRHPEIFLDAGFVLERKEGGHWEVNELVERLEVYAGELLPGFYDEWIILDRERLKAAFDQKMRRLLDLLEAHQRWEELLDWSERWIGMGHVPEPAYRALMLVHAVQKDLSAVTAAYQRCQKALREELGVAPSKELRDSYQELLRGEIPEPSKKIPLEMSVIASAPPAPGTPPYKGLEYFDVSDAGLFFGRQELAKRLVSRLKESGMLAVVGASGSGKSSVVRAGLVPALFAEKHDPGLVHLTETPSTWQVRILTPTPHPLQALVDHMGGQPGFLEDLSLDDDALKKRIRNLAEQKSGESFLLVVDQFEEIFTLCQDEDERQAFLKNLLSAGRQSREGAELKAGAAVVIVLRADFYAQCGRYPALREALSSCQEYLGPMTAEELRSAIEEPAARNGWFFEPGLVDLLIREVHGEPGGLPLLSHALLETWKRRSGHWMTLKGYAEAGGVHGSIARTAESVFNRQLDGEQQKIARRIFLRLSALGDDDTGGTRRRAVPSEFTAEAAQAEAVDYVLNVLAASRLITRSENSVEVAHEALIREWPALRRWLDEDREGLRLHHHLVEAARYWESLGRDSGDLYRGVRLAQAMEWWGKHPERLNPLERQFLEAGCAEEDRQQIEKEGQQRRELEAARQLAVSEKKRAEQSVRANRQLRLFAAGITLIFLATLAAAWVAVAQRDRANRTTHLAHSRELAAAAINNLELDPQLSILLSLEAVKESQVAGEAVAMEIENALHQAVRLSRQRLVLSGHTRGVFGSSFSPDGKLVATASKDGTVKIWQADRGNLIRTIQDHQSTVMSVHFHPNGRWLATAGRDHTTRVWDVETGQQVWSYTDDLSFSNLARFSPDGSLVGSVFWDGRVLMFDAATGQLQQVINTNSMYVFWFEFTPDGKQVATADNEGVVQLFDTYTGEEQERIDFESYSQTFLSISPNGDRMAVASMDGWLKLWDLNTRQMIWTISGEPGSKYSNGSFSPDGKYLVTSGIDGSAKIWESANGNLVMTLTGHTGTVYSAGFSLDGTRILTGSEDGTARIWDFSPAREVANIQAPKGADVPAASRRAVFSPDGRWIAAGEGDGGAVGVWDAGGGSRVMTLTNQASQSQVTGVAFHPTGRSLAAARIDGTITIWELASGNVVKQWQAHQGGIISIHYLQNGALLASLGQDSVATLWDAQSGELYEFIGSQSGPLMFLAVSPDNTSLLTTTYLGALRMIDIQTGQETGFFRGQIGDVWDVTFSHNAKMIASASDDGSVVVWEVATRKKIFVFDHSTSTPVGVAFSPDDRQLATISFDAALRLFDLETGQPVMVLEKASVKRPSGVVFSPHGRTLAVTSEDGISLYLTRLEDLIELAQSRLARTFTNDECVRYAISGCSTQAAVETPVALSSREKERMLACHLPDIGSITLNPFNWAVHQGMLSAAEQFGWDTWTVEPLFVKEMDEFMQDFLQSDCDVILISSFDKATLADPEDHPEQRFWFMEAEDENLVWENVWAEVYRADQPSFLAGYLAAGMTRTGKVGVFGGQPMPPVLVFMDGFALGVDYYNQQHATFVELVGWQTGGGGAGGVFTGFWDPQIGYKATKELIESGVDIIFPVAGKIMMEAASQAALAMKDILVIGVDEDWAAAHPQYASVTLTSAVKHFDKSPYWVMEAITNGVFSGGMHYADLENGGVSLAPYYGFEDKIPDRLKAELEQVKRDIIAGKIHTK